MRPRISLSLLEDDRIIHVRYIGDLSGAEVSDAVIAQYATVEAPWHYDILIDMRRFEGAVLASDIEDLGARWTAMMGGRDAGRFAAAISADPHVQARFGITQAAFPNLTMRLFPDINEGLYWLKGQRQTIRLAS